MKTNILQEKALRTEERAKCAENEGQGGEDRLQKDGNAEYVRVYITGVEYA